MRPFILALLITTFAHAEDTPEEKKLDWSKPETVEAFFNFAADKYKWPATVTSHKASYNAKEKPAIFGVLFEIDKPVKDDMTKTTYAAANIIGQIMAKGAPLDKTGVIFKTKDGSTATVLLPPADLKKLGDESIKGAKADKAALNKMVGALIAKCDWKEVDALIKKDMKPAP
ncbi:MAG TPA: hypothetical protein VKX17_01290 [Planctomycetota bacterium]|nr:hypothetical protein [Planctomycetota bacterium]